MALKMNELIKRTDTPKSTLLYYIKEGLLSEPEKPKPNLHLYDERCVEIVAFIKYLQNNFGSSISEIKAIVSEADFNSGNGFEVLLNRLDAILSSEHKERFSEAEILERCDITAEKLQHYLDAGLLFKRHGAFSLKELDILQMLLRLEAEGIDAKVLEPYVRHARELSKFEVAFARDFLATKRPDNAIKALFDTTLLLKPYLFNMHTLKAYQKEES